MARAGMALRRGTNHTNTDATDDVQRSIELLDRVLSEFDDVENANQVQNIHQLSTSASTPQLRELSVSTPLVSGNKTTPEELESPSLGHQSEDDGYMSMNGRKPTKFNLAFKPLAEVPVHHENASLTPHIQPLVEDDFPPPPEEAQRLIATLLPRVSPVHKPKANNIKNRGFPLTQLPHRIETIPPPQNFQNNDSSLLNGLPEPMHSATQTTLPKTRHQRPYGWENDFSLNPPPPPPGYRFGSLPFHHLGYPIISPTRVPPRTIPTAIEKHREVTRGISEDNISSDMEEIGLRPLSELADDEHFSDDSLEEGLPLPPPPVNKRASIAWEVPLDDETMLTPGSTKVIGRRRRKSGSYSSTSSIPNKVKELDDWPDPPPCTTEDEVTSPFSDSDEHVTLPAEIQNMNLTGGGTFIIRKNKKERRHLINACSSLTSNSSLNSRLSSDMSIPVSSRFSGEIASCISRDLNTPNSRYSVDLTESRHSQDLHSPKSRYSLDLNNSRRLSQELSSSPSRLSADLSSSRSSTPQSKHEFKKHSTTFDNIKSLIREGVIDTYNAPPPEHAPDYIPPTSPIIRVVSLPSLNAEEFAPRRELGVTVEEEEEGESSQQSNEISPLRKIEQNISELLECRDIEVLQDGTFVLNGVDSLMKKKNMKKSKNRDSKIVVNNDLQKSTSQSEIQKTEEYYRRLLIEGSSPFPKRGGIQKSESAKEMKIAHREKEKISTSTSADFPAQLQHEFPPLPPSPVEEDDEYSEIGSSNNVILNGQPPSVPPHRDPSSSLKTRSMDANYSRGKRSFIFGASSRNVPQERRTLPAELQENKKKPNQKKRASQSPQDEPHLQTSCSLPETPIFARGCDIPRTPHRRAPDVPANQTTPRQSSTMSSIYTIGNMSTGGFRRGNSNSFEQAAVGTELLRLGGPGRGWYPKQRSRRPVSIEHLDRMAPGHNPWEPSRKPLTLPPNLTPKFFQRSPRDALRRVTSLLIRKGNGKDNKKDKDPAVSPTIQENGEEVQKKKGFFKSLWKKSRHYSLEQQ